MKTQAESQQGAASPNFWTGQVKLTVRANERRQLCRLNSQRVVAYKGPKIYNADVYPGFARDYFQLLADLLVLGALTHRQAVVPPVDCASPWITRNPRARGGVEQVCLPQEQYCGQCRTERLRAVVALTTGQAERHDRGNAMLCVSASIAQKALSKFQRCSDEIALGSACSARQHAAAPSSAGIVQTCTHTRSDILQIPWRWDWKPEEKQLNGAGLCNCSTVAPGTTDGPASGSGDTRASGGAQASEGSADPSTDRQLMADQDASVDTDNSGAIPAGQNTTRDEQPQLRDGSADDGLCCFPYLTGNAVFPACSAAGLGFYHFVDLQHVVTQQPTNVDGTAHAQRAVVLDAKALGLTGTLAAEQVRARSCWLRLAPHPTWLQRSAAR